MRRHWTISPSSTARTTTSSANTNHSWQTKSSSWWRWSSWKIMGKRLRRRKSWMRGLNSTLTGCMKIKTWESYLSQKSKIKKTLMNCWQWRMKQSGKKCLSCVSNNFCRESWIKGGNVSKRKIFGRLWNTPTSPMITTTASLSLTKW